MEWIDAKECLPARLKGRPRRVLILLDNTVYIGVTDGNLWAVEVDEGNFQILLGRNVTHWMPLPKSPYKYYSSTQ